MRTTKYSRDGLIVLSKKFSTRAELRTYDGNRSYNMMKHLGIVKECTAHMPDCRVAHKRSTAELIESARQFTAVSAWKLSRKSDYKLAKYRGILADCTSHMPGVDRQRQVYAYEFPDKSVYVGVVAGEEIRSASQSGPPNIRERAAVAGFQPINKVLEPIGTCHNKYAALEAKRAWIERYRSDGWTILNLVARPTGLPRQVDPDTIIEQARRFKTRAEWVSACPREYRQARHMGLLDQIYAFLDKGAGRVSAYSDDELLSDALKFRNRIEWKSAGSADQKIGKPSHYVVAMKRGARFFSRCCAHMERAPRPPMKLKYSDEEIIASARLYKTLKEWKRADRRLYSASRRTPELCEAARAHFIPASNPYAGDYFIYAFEFADRHAYVGLTFRESRYDAHMVRGPVYEHIKICPEFNYKKVQTGIQNPTEVKKAEAAWLKRYRSDGWIMLNRAKAGSIGTVAKAWTKERLIEDALKYRTRFDWRRASQYAVLQAKKMGIYKLCSAHMVRPKVVAPPISEETRRRMSEAAKNRTRRRAA